MLGEYRGENWTLVRADIRTKSSKLSWKSPDREDGTGFLKQTAKKLVDMKVSKNLAY